MASVVWRSLSAKSSDLFCLNRIVLLNYRRFSNVTSNGDNVPSDLSDKLRERARMRIAELDSQQSLSPNSPLGILDRSPGVDPNATPNSGISSPDYMTKFPPFPNDTNPDTGEVNGPLGPEPTRFGDWEHKGRCSDF